SSAPARSPPAVVRLLKVQPADGACGPPNQRLPGFPPPVRLLIFPRSFRAATRFPPKSTPGGENIPGKSNPFSDFENALVRQTCRCKDFVPRIRPSRTRGAPSLRGCREALSYRHPKHRKERPLHCAQLPWRYRARPRSGEPPFGMIGKDRAPLIAELPFPSKKVCPLICSKHDAKTRACHSYVRQKAAVEGNRRRLPG